MPIRMRILLVALALSAWRVGPAAAQCYSRSPYLDGSNQCGTETAGLQYEFYSANRSYFVSADKEYLIATMSNDLDVYDVTANPLGPVRLTTPSIHIPFDWCNIIIGSGGDTCSEPGHQPYLVHLRHIATLSGFRYGVVMLADYGWDFFKLAGNQSKFLGNGYHPTHNLQQGSYNSAALFQTGNNIYAAAQTLDQTSITNSDFSIRIYKIGVVGNPAFTEALTPSNIAANSAVVPIGHVGDPLPQGQFSLAMGGMKLFRMYASSGKTFLIARSAGSMGIPDTVAVVDVSDPTSPQLASFSQDTTLAGTNMDVDEGRMMIWAGDRHVAKVYGYNVDPTSGAITGGPTVEYIAGAPSVGYSLPSAAGNLLVVSAGTKIGYVSLAGNGTPTVLPDMGVPYSTLPTRDCLNTAYSEGCTSITAFVTGNHHYVCRSLGYDQDIVGVSDSCLGQTGTDGGAAEPDAGTPDGDPSVDTNPATDTSTATDAVIDGGGAPDSGSASTGSSGCGCTESGLFHLSILVAGLAALLLTRSRRTRIRGPDK